MIQGLLLKAYKPMSVAEMAALAVYLKFITNHWTAGSYTWTSDHYHFNICFDEKTGKAYVVQTRSLRKPGSHTSMRNTGNIGCSMACMGVNPKTKQAYLPKPQQVQVMAEVNAELIYLFGPRNAGDLAKGKKLQLSGLHDHAYWAKIDGYGPGSGHRETRIDIAGYQAQVYEKASQHLAKLMTGVASVVHLVGVK